jgi:UDP-glucose 4-epimerase
VAGADAIVHAATLHKPHVGSHERRQFVDTNITGTLNLLEEAVAAGVSRFIFTSTTSTFGRALTPEEGAPAAWISEDVVPVPRNIYGTTKTAAENLCELIAHDHGLPCLILRTSRFFPEPDDRDEVRSAYEDLNLKVN